MMEKIIVDGIEVKITRKKIKNVNLSVHPPNGEVRVSAPFKVREERIRLFVLGKMGWITKQQAKFKNYKTIKALEYVTGEDHYFLGNKYLLNIININKNPSRVEIREGYIDVYVKEEYTKEQREKLLKEWYRKQLKKLITPLITRWESVMGVQVAEFGVKQMKTRWGTCNISAKRIWINLELARKSPECLEYIVVHEMVHLLERNHNDKFKAYMNQFLPNWVSIRDKLNS